MKRSMSGFSMIEVLITIAILVVGLLGLASLQANVAKAELEAYQRAQALVLVQELSDRLIANKAHAAEYVKTDIGVGGVEKDCLNALAGSDRDLCEFNNALVGASEKTGAGGATIGAMIGARACVTNPSPNLYMITIAWQGVRRTAKPTEDCGRDQYGDDSLRRTVSFPVRVATLTVS
jgi:type IV pilus assembly protein PilV